MSPSEYNSMDRRNKFGSLAPILYGHEHENSVRLKAPRFLKAPRKAGSDSSSSEGESLPWIKRSSNIDTTSMHADRSVEQIRVPYLPGEAQTRETRNLSNLSSIERLKNIINLPGNLNREASKQSINPNGCLLVNDSSQKRIVLLGEIVANTHKERHLRFLKHKQSMMDDAESH